MQIASFSCVRGRDIGGLIGGVLDSSSFGPHCIGPETGDWVCGLWWLVVA
jgi:hypothetical protein